MTKEIQKISRELAEVEAVASLMEMKAAALKNHCRRTRARLEGVSTPSRRKAGGLSEEDLALIIAKRNSKIKTIPHGKKA